MSIYSRRRGDLSTDVTTAAVQNDKLLSKKRQDKTPKDGIAFIAKHLAVLDQAKTVIMVGFFPRLKQITSDKLKQKTKTFCIIAEHIKKHEHGKNLGNNEWLKAVNLWKKYIPKSLFIHLGPFRKKVSSYRKYEFAYNTNNLKKTGRHLPLLSKFHMMVSMNRFCVKVPEAINGKIPLDIGILGKNT